MPAGTLGPPRTGSFLICGVVVLPVWPSAATQHGQGSGNMGVFEGPEPSAAFLRVDAARISPIGPNTDLGFQASTFHRRFPHRRLRRPFLRLCPSRPLHRWQSSSTQLPRASIFHECGNDFRLTRFPCRPSSWNGQVRIRFALPFVLRGQVSFRRFLH